jgi:uncharacterized protein YcbX
VSSKHFRPNIVLDVPAADNHNNPEDEWAGLDISGVSFVATGKCKRCSMVNMDPTSGSNDGSTLRALSTFRRDERSRIVFGIFVRRKEEAADDEVWLEVGSEVDIITNTN